MSVGPIHPGPWPPLILTLCPLPWLSHSSEPALASIQFHGCIMCPPASSLHLHLPPPTLHCAWVLLLLLQIQGKRHFFMEGLSHSSSSVKSPCQLALSLLFSTVVGAVCLMGWLDYCFSVAPGLAVLLSTLYPVASTVLAHTDIQRNVLHEWIQE